MTWRKSLGGGVTLDTTERSVRAALRANGVSGKEADWRLYALKTRAWDGPQVLRVEKPTPTEFIWVDGRRARARPARVPA